MSHSNERSSSHASTSIAISLKDSATWYGKSRLISKITLIPHKNISRTRVKPLGLVGFNFGPPRAISVAQIKSSRQAGRGSGNRRRESSQHGLHCDSLLVQLRSMACVLPPLRHASPSIVLPKKSLLDLRIDAMKPLLRSVGSFPIRGDFASSSATRSSAARSLCESFCAISSAWRGPN
jgi:hypothetical protein